MLFWFLLVAIICGVLFGFRAFLMVLVTTFFLYVVIPLVALAGAALFLYSLIT